MTAEHIPAVRELGPDPEPYGSRFELLLEQAVRRDARVQAPRQYLNDRAGGRRPAAVLRIP